MELVDGGAAVERLEVLPAYVVRWVDFTTATAADELPLLVADVMGLGS